MTDLAAKDYLMRPYARVITPDDGSFRAEILEFPGCLALGDTPVEALQKIEDVAESWIESTLARGLKIPPPVGERE